ncbi:hypothetical protein [Streptomyces anulatus]|uniref:hypothetical protein n=1 Tax=Streptomyces anulatus TaxID=1892 RepID=UPI003659827B
MDTGLPDAFAGVEQHAVEHAERRDGDEQQREDRGQRVERVDHVAAGFAPAGPRGDLQGAPGPC